MTASSGTPPERPSSEPHAEEASAAQPAADDQATSPEPAAPSESEPAPEAQEEPSDTPASQSAATPPAAEASPAAAAPDVAVEPDVTPEDDEPAPARVDSSNAAGAEDSSEEQDPTPAAPVEMIIEVCGRTDVGLLREQNEDFFLVGDVEGGELCGRDGATLICRDGERGPVLLVCDGLGGAAAGEVASQLAGETIWEEMAIAQETAERAVYARLLRRAVRAANRRVWDTGRRNPKQRGMGTTVSAGGVVGSTLILAQVGDSRAYILRDDILVQLTRDQSLVSALVRSGQLSEEDAHAMPGSNMVLQALGVRKDVEVALSVAELRRGDVLLLCSDGLHGPVSWDKLQRALGADAPVPAIADRLIELALLAGAPDNVTAVVARFDGDALTTPHADEEQLRFTELDPMEEGSQGLFSTSVIVRRLAARIGIGEDPGPPVVPATGQFKAIRRSRRGDGADPGGPAARALQERSQLSASARFLAVLAALSAIVYLFWRFW